MEIKVSYDFDIFIPNWVPKIQLKNKKLHPGAGWGKQKVIVLNGCNFCDIQGKIGNIHQTL